MEEEYVHLVFFTLPFFFKGTQIRKTCMAQGGEGGVVLTSAYTLECMQMDCVGQSVSRPVSPPGFPLSHCF